MFLEEARKGWTGRQACWQVPSLLELSHWPKFLPSLTIVNDAACEHGCSNCQLKSLLPVLLNIYLKVELVGLFLGVYCLAYKQHQFTFLIITNSSFSFCHPHQQSLTSFYDTDLKNEELFEHSFSLAKNLNLTGTDWISISEMCHRRFLCAHLAVDQPTSMTKDEKL